MKTAFVLGAFYAAAVKAVSLEFNWTDELKEVRPDGCNTCTPVAIESVKCGTVFDGDILYF